MRMFCPLSSTAGGSSMLGMLCAWYPKSSQYAMLRMQVPMCTVLMADTDPTGNTPILVPSLLYLFLM